jgi:hypothetical protein
MRCSPSPVPERRRAALRIGVAALALCGAAAARAQPAADGAAPTAEQIVGRHVAARGGLAAWSKVRTMLWVGHIDSAGASEPNLQFALQMKRPDKTRFEVSVQRQRSVRAFDGVHGWKLHTGREGRPEVQPYTADELQFAREVPGIDAPLLDAQAKGATVALEGVDAVDGRKAYRLGVTLPSGTHQHVWIDVETFLDVKYERLAHGPRAGGAVAVVNRRFETFEGLQIPTTVEIGAGSGKAPDRMVIERVAINRPLPDRMFAKPDVFRERGVPGLGAAAQ